MTNFEKYYATHGVDSRGHFFIELKDSVKSNHRFMKLKNHEEFVNFMLENAEIPEKTCNFEQLIGEITLLLYECYDDINEKTFKVEYNGVEIQAHIETSGWTQGNIIGTFSCATEIYFHRDGEISYGDNDFFNEAMEIAYEDIIDRWERGEIGIDYESMPVKK